MVRNVLVIDDENSVGTLLRINLRQKGYAVEIALSGSDGVALAKQKRFDLVILDVALPGIDGIETCQLLKALEGYREVPVIMISSRADSVTQEKARQAGASAYLTKPFTFDQLQERAVDLMSRPYL